MYCFAAYHKARPSRAINEDVYYYYYYPVQPSLQNDVTHPDNAATDA